MYIETLLSFTSHLYIAGLAKSVIFKPNQTPNPALKPTPTPDSSSIVPVNQGPGGTRGLLAGRWAQNPHQYVMNNIQNRYYAELQRKLLHIVKLVH